MDSGNADQDDGDMHMKYYLQYHINSRHNHKPAAELEIRGECFSRIIECYDNNHVYFKRRTGGRGSLQHGMAINKLLRYVKTKYVLILDPDFYVFVDDWIANVCSHCRLNDLAFFGSPFDPRHYKKYRYFPITHFFLIDLEKVDRKQLDFRSKTDTARYAKQEGTKCASLLRSLGKKYIGNHFLRQIVGSSRDVGYRVYDKFVSDSSFRREMLKGVYVPYDTSRFGSRFYFFVKMKIS